MKSAYEGLVDMTVMFAYAIAATAILFLAVPSLRSEAAAGWVQAIGSLATISMAIIVVRLQAADARRINAEKDQNELRLTMQSIKTELKIHGFAIEHIIAELEKTILTGKVVVFPFISTTFYIFSTAAGKIGMVQNQILREKIIAAYAEFNSVHTTVNRISELARKYDSKKDSGTSDEAELRSYSQQVLPIAEDLIQSIKTVGEIIDRDYG